jgi:hypothetical protein
VSPCRGLHPSIRRRTAIDNPPEFGKEAVFSGDVAKARKPARATGYEPPSVTTGGVTQPPSANQRLQEEGANAGAPRLNRASAAHSAAPDVPETLRGALQFVLHRASDPRRD